MIVVGTIPAGPKSFTPLHASSPTYRVHVRSYVAIVSFAHCSPCIIVEVRIRLNPAAGDASRSIRQLPYDIRRMPCLQSRSVHWEPLLLLELHSCRSRIRAVVSYRLAFPSHRADVGPAFWIALKKMNKHMTDMYVQRHQ